MFSKVNQTLQRILSVDWTIDYQAATLHRTLMKEHFRRMVMWARELDCIDHWPFFSVALHLAPLIRVEPEIISTLRQHLKRLDFYSDLNRGILEHSLEWAAILDKASSRPKPSLHDPYEPILIMYERGGIFSKVDESLIMASETTGFAQGKWSDFDKLKPYIELDLTDVVMPNGGVT